MIYGEKIEFFAEVPKLYDITGDVMVGRGVNDQFFKDILLILTAIKM